MQCFIVEPIHEDGVRAIERLGVSVRQASRASLDAAEGEIGGAEICVSRSLGIGRRLIAAAPRLALICHHGVGLERVDVADATERRIPVTFTPSASSRSVAEQAIFLALAVAKHAITGDEATRRGAFESRFAHGNVELWRKTFGVIGFGRVGRIAAEIASRGLGMRVNIYTRTLPPAEIELHGWAVSASLPDLLQNSDVVSIHVPLGLRTRHLIGNAELGMMKPTAILINVARGEIVDEAALVAALESGRIAGAGLDVFATEDGGARSRFADLPNVVLSPHVGGATGEAASRAAMTIAAQIASALRGAAPNDLVNPQIWSVRVPLLP